MIVITVIAYVFAWIIFSSLLQLLYCVTSIYRRGSFEVGDFTFSTHTLSRYVAKLDDVDFDGVGIDQDEYETMLELLYHPSYPVYSLCVFHGDTLVGSFNATGLRLTQDLMAKNAEAALATYPEMKPLIDAHVEAVSGFSEDGQWALSDGLKVDRWYAEKCVFPWWHGIGALNYLWGVDTNLWKAMHKLISFSLKNRGFDRVLIVSSSMNVLHEENVRMFETTPPVLVTEWNLVQ